MWIQLQKYLQTGAKLLFPYTPYFVIGLILIVIFTFSMRAIKEKREKKRLQRERLEKERSFTLPDRENSFVRERLNGVLREKRETDDKKIFAVDGEKLRLEYVRGLISKTKASPISAADRLEINRLSKRITEIVSQELLTLRETYELSDCFLSVIRLAAKYAV